MDASLGELVRTYRSRSGISQEMLAERCGLSPRAVSDIETGAAKSPRLVTLMLIGEALDLPSADRLRLQHAGRKPGAPDVNLASMHASGLKPTRLEGRDADVAHLETLIMRDATRLVTLVGPVGVGKTSLAVNAALQRAVAFRDGIAIVEMYSLKEPSLAPLAVARALNGESLDVTPRETVEAYLSERNMLLVLDNLEHLAPAVSWIEDLLAASPRLKVLATSREPLRLAVEQVYAVRPLDGDAASRLFVRRAKDVRPDFELTDANAAAVATIVQRLEGLPLAIELAAPLLSTLTPKALAARLEHRLPLLGGGAIDRPARQQTMHGAIAWSYDLLPAHEQRLFRRLSVLQGGGSLGAAAAVASETREEGSILARLAPLVEKNLVSLAGAANDEPRVGMLEMLREFAHDRLVESGELDAVQRAHVGYFASFAEEISAKLGDVQQRRWLFRLEVEQRNIEAALQWTARSGEPKLGLRVIAGVWRFWQLRGRPSVGLDWISRFGESANLMAAGVDDGLFARVLGAAAVLHLALGNFNESIESCERAIALQRGIGDEPGLAASLSSLGVARQFRGELDVAEIAVNESLEIRTRLGDDAGIASCLSDLASFFQNSGELTRAAALAQESAAIYRRLDDRSGLARALMKIGLIAAAEREYDRADAVFAEVLALQRESDDTASMHYTLSNLASVAYGRRRYDVALTRFREALDLLGLAPNASALATTLADMAKTISATGDAAKAARLLGAAETLRSALGSPVFPTVRSEHDAEVARIRARLGDDSFLVQWRIGLSMTPERALDEARAR
jgi:predicted ATPase/transcriptional regulator with XRE-family HTH domain